MAFKMKGSPAKIGGIQGTSGHNKDYENNSDHPRGSHSAAKMKSPLEQTADVTPADKKEYDERVGDYVRQSAIVKGSKKAERMKKRRLKKEARAAKAPKKGINIDFRKTRSNKKGTGGRIGIRLIPKITRQGRGITWN